jgi:sulfite reductase (ferredoxin)
MGEAVAKETKAQRVERLKRELNPWEAHAEIQRFAREGWDAVPPEWLGTYFRWWGIYTQGDGVGAVGGKGGEGKAVRHFMVRIRIPNGVIESHQLRTIADLAEWHGRGVADITVRQNFQLHWVTLENLPDVFHALWLQGVTTIGSCGDVTRNVTGCPVAGLDADELVDASPLVLEATRMLNGNPAFYNLPRKFKVSISGCRAWCTYPEINDIGFTAVRHPATGEIGFSVRVGGGLSTDPHLGVRLDAFVPWGGTLAVLRAIAEIFRDSEVLRQNRERARLKFLFLQHGWTAERFRAAIEDRLGWSLRPGVPDDPPDDAYRDHVGIHPQKNLDSLYAGVAVLRGRLTADQMRVAADLADRYGTGALRTTSMQNLVIPNVPRARARALARELEAADFVLDASPFRRGTVACTGSEFCKLALTETKGFARGLVEALERRLPGFDQHLRINITGCPNSCGQHWIADLGIEGKKIKVDGALVDA